MTKVEFHSQAADRLTYACRLLRKAHTSAARVLVTAEADTLAQLHDLLWTFSSTDFIPHCLAQADPQVLARSPIVLAERITADAPQTILLNLKPEVPAGYEQFPRVIEIVSTDATDKQQARQRWKHYAQAGCQLRNHDLQARHTAQAGPDSPES